MESQDEYTSASNKDYHPTSDNVPARYRSQTTVYRTRRQANRNSSVLPGSDDIPIQNLQFRTNEEQRYNEGLPRLPALCAPARTVALYGHCSGHPRSSSLPAYGPDHPPSRDIIFSPCTEKAVCIRAAQQKHLDTRSLKKAMEHQKRTAKRDRAKKRQDINLQGSIGHIEATELLLG